MHTPSARGDGELWKQEGHSEAGDVHERHREATPLDPACVCFGLWIKRSKNVTCNRRNVKQPHAKEPEPGEDLYRGKLSHGARHLAQRRDDLAKARRQSRLFPAHAIESFHVIRRIFFGGKNRPQYSQKKCHGTNLKGILYRQRNTALSVAGHTETAKR